MKEITLNWDQDFKEIIQQFERILKRITDGTEYYVEINKKDSSRCVNVYKLGCEKRIAHLWPIKKGQVIHVNVTREIFEQLKGKMPLPEDSDIKKDRYPNWRAFKNTDYETAISIVEEIVKL